MDATLRELSDLVKEVKPAARGRMTRLSFAFVYPDKRGRNVMRQVGNQCFFLGISHLWHLAGLLICPVLMLGGTERSFCSSSPDAP